MKTKQEIISIETNSDCLEDNTINVTARANNIIETFRVQTVDGVHRVDLGCWIMTNTSNGDLDASDYPDFYITDIIREAEDYIQTITTETATHYYISGERVYLIIKQDLVSIVTRNDKYINEDESSYQREFSDTIETFDNKKEALEYLENLE